MGEFAGVGEARIKEAVPAQARRQVGHQAPHGATSSVHGAIIKASHTEAMLSSISAHGYSH